MPDDPIPVRTRIELPADAEVGVYADFVSVWHTPEAFVLDFVSLKGPAELLHDDEDGSRYALREARVASRVRVSPTHVFELMRALEHQLSAWEAETGAAPGGTPPAA